ncbi:MAG: class I SAM-dependent methyltransferase [Pseudomonadota bacterium]
MSKTPTLAAQADIYALFQQTMQDPEFEVAFITQRFQELRGRTPQVLREDFCGVGTLSAQWARHAPEAVAHGVDERGDMLEWCQTHNLGAAALAQRVQLHRGDVSITPTPAADVLTAFNFAYSRHKTRAALRQYFAAARQHLKPDGLFVLDAFGGTEVMGQTIEETALEDQAATFIWDQEHFNPITHELLAHIHFEFDDESEIEKAFTFDWRLWTLPELHELLLEAGFKKVQFYWEKFVDADELDEDDDLDDEDDDENLDDEDLDDEEVDDDALDDDELDEELDILFDDGDDEMVGTGEYYAVTDVENQESWVAYIVAEA